jgi:hypothetical protein
MLKKNLTTLHLCITPRITGLEPITIVLKTIILPLNYTLFNPQHYCKVKKVSLKK